ncbi:haloalkane dehalogenase [Parasedimentitalea psychrophila]|uniref:Haloalkane dehalogenase n=1 Tax=Parasedimentitalea psychrophila TaxID=2997337 RepID=A0A9Y2P0D8_9RHOB|nr:haloalkane dehalogenase [Parasedimentitalea psychrophila]WIY24511.1 haloalkane dehalogenase [Parasedimentitalea psychrophila]
MSKLETFQSTPVKSGVFRTPDSAFANLPDFQFEPNYIDVDGMRMHYVDQGRDNPRTIFLLHGQPSWSYLYRKMIPLFVAAGYRVIAPDLIGFGRSDKPANSDAHSYQAHVNWMTTFVQKLGIKDATVFMQDWGGMIGLRVLANNPDWASHLVVANTALGNAKGPFKYILPRMLKAMRVFAGKPKIEDLAAKQSYGNWAGYFLRSPKLDFGKVMQILTNSKLSAAEMSAYDAPIADHRFYAGPRKMPQIVVEQQDEGRDAWAKLGQSNRPVLTLFSDKDPFLADTGYDKQFQALPGAASQPHETITNASHFLQEDKGVEIADKVLKWLQSKGY